MDSDNAVEKLEAAIKEAEQNGGKNVFDFASLLKRDLEEKGKKAIELNFVRYASEFLSSIILDRMAEVPRMVKFVSVCDELLYGKETHTDLIELSLRNPRLLESKRNMAKEFVDATVSLASKLSKGIQDNTEEEGSEEESDLSAVFRRKVSKLSKEQLLMFLEKFDEIFEEE